MAPRGDALSTDLAAFLAEHERCGELDTGMTGDPARVWITCTCGARIEARAEEDEAP
jgi:hypothetical protein